MDPKRKALVDRTNFGDLIQPTMPELDLNQPVETASPPTMEPARSTTDPLQINFAVADIAGKLQESRTGTGVKAFALVFLGGPMMIFGLGVVYMAWTSTTATRLGTLYATVVGLLFVGFWPWLVLANRRKRSQSR